MVGWHHLLNGHEFEQTPGDSEGQENWHAVVPGAAKSQTQKMGKKQPTTTPYSAPAQAHFSNLLITQNLA